MKRCMTGLTAAAVLTAIAETFFVSGYPPENTCYPTASDGVALVTGTLSTPTAASALEARFRTWDASEGAALDTTPWDGFIFLIK